MFVPLDAMQTSTVQDLPVPAGITSFAAHETEEMTKRAQDVGWTVEYLARGCSFDAEVAVVRTPRAQLTRAHFRSPCLSRGEGPQGTYVFVLSQPRSGNSRLGGESFESTQLGLLRPGLEHEFHTSASDEVLLLAIPRDWVEREALACWGRPFSEVGDRWTLAFEDLRTAHLLGAGWSSLLEENLRRPEILSGGETARQIEEELPREMLRLIAPPQPKTSGLARRRAARHAEAYLRENMSHSVSLNDLCREAGACERTLREGFRELYGFSPLPYLKALRLHGARAQLQKAERNRRISNIAIECGFTHLGRFSVDYHRTFGETPSQTRSR